jgi:transketolase
MLSKNDVAFLKEKALEIRKDTIDQIGHLGFGHIGGALSVVEVITILYYRFLNVDPNDPRKEGRDIFVLSKGHAGPALYSALASKGYFPKEELHTLNQPGTNLPSHCDRLRTPGMDMTAGSLGQGLSAAIGVALGYRMDKRDATIYCVVGDGESNEGQVWEAAMSAAHFRLENLVAFTDCNRLQLDSWTEEIMGLGDLVAKWDSFGWHTQRVDGHDFNALDEAISNARAHKGQPSMIILDTIKGKGAPFAENRPDNHHMMVSNEAAQEAIRQLSSEV